MPRPASPYPALAAALLGASIFSASTSLSAAQERATPETIAVEINKLEPMDADCQATMVATNGEAKLDSLKLDLVIFDASGVVAKRIAAEFGPLASAKTVIKTFAVKGLGCASISRVVLNDVLACRGPGGPVADCLDRLAVRSRATATFGK